ncbi:MAG: SDR family NAD(P)-dependent oxidoreductase [Gammaproteobacteria bacterium]|nr:SDR family NAD(P)-dependent oxidoreductase [Gammaproteobacteria bacterium]
MSIFKLRYGPWALITGASSGIGTEFAHQLAEKGLNLILVARREDRLNILARGLINKHSIEAKVVAIDLSKDDFLSRIKNSITNLEIGLLINNAGLINTGPFIDNDLNVELKLLHVNCRATLMLAHELGKQMRDRKRGGIIFLASTVAFASVPRWANYCASESYDLMLAEGLAVELKDHGVDVLALCPGFTRTEIQTLARINDFLAMDTGPVVRLALDKLGKSNVVVPGLFNKFASFSTRLQPRSFNTFIFEQVVRPTQQQNQ